MTENKYIADIASNEVSGNLVFSNCLSIHHIGKINNKYTVFEFHSLENFKILINFYAFCWFIFGSIIPILNTFLKL